MSAAATCGSSRATDFRDEPTAPGGPRSKSALRPLEIALFRGLCDATAKTLDRMLAERPRSAALTGAYLRLDTLRAYLLWAMTIDANVSVVVAHTRAQLTASAVEIDRFGGAYSAVFRIDLAHLSREWSKT